MGHKIFVSYKYSDRCVQSLAGQLFGTTARHYVDSLSNVLEAQDHIYKGEDDGQSLADFRESTITSKLREKIFDSTITIVLISRGMKDLFKEDNDQWIPWEVAYSLRQKSREGRLSTPNALIGVVLPDETGSYSYFIQDEACPWCKCRSLKTDFLFAILKNNTFNTKKPVFLACNQHTLSGSAYQGDASYMHIVKWNDLMASVSHHLKIAQDIRNASDDYDICKRVA
jgi:hypothetical protein